MSDADREEALLIKWINLYRDVLNWDNDGQPINFENLVDGLVLNKLTNYLVKSNSISHQSEAKTND